MQWKQSHLVNKPNDEFYKESLHRFDICESWIFHVEISINWSQYGRTSYVVCIHFFAFLFFCWLRGKPNFSFIILINILEILTTTLICCVILHRLLYKLSPCLTALCNFWTKSKGSLSSFVYCILVSIFICVFKRLRQNMYTNEWIRITAKRKGVQITINCKFCNIWSVYMEPLDDNAIRKKKPRSAVFNNGYLCRIIVPCSGFLHFMVVTRDLSFDYIWKMNEKKSRFNVGSWMFIIYVNFLHSCANKRFTYQVSKLFIPCMTKTNFINKLR